MEAEKLFITHVQSLGPYLKIFGQTSKENMHIITSCIETTLRNYLNRSPIKFSNLAIGKFCLALFCRTNYCRGKIVNITSMDDIVIHFIDYGCELHLNMQEILMLDPTSLEAAALQKFPAQVSCFILSGFYCDWDTILLKDVVLEICNKDVHVIRDVEISDYVFAQFIWQQNSLTDFLVEVKKIGLRISLDQQKEAFLKMIINATKIRTPKKLNLIENTPKMHISGLVPIRSSLHTIENPNQVLINGKYIGQQQFPSHIRVPYEAEGIENDCNKVNVYGEIPMPVSTNPFHIQSPFATFKKNSLSMDSIHYVYCSYADNGPCSFTVHLLSTEKDMAIMMKDLEKTPVKNLSGEPVIGMACVAKFSEDGKLYRAVIMAINSTMCQVSYVDYGNVEWVPFHDLYEIPTQFLEYKTFALSFALSGYKILEPIDETIKIEFKNLVQHKKLRLKVVPLEGPPLVQYCALYDENLNILNMLKTYKNKKLAYLPVEQLETGENVVIRYIESPNMFFVQKVCNINEFDKMMDDLFFFCNKNQIKLKEFKIGVPCAVKIENAWYRAEIIDQISNKITIRHVDFGKERNVDYNQLCLLTEMFTKLPPQAIPCCLKGFENNEIKSESATVQLEMLAENSDGVRRHFKCETFEVLKNGRILVNLTDDTMMPKLNLMKSLYKLNLPLNKYIGLEKEGLIGNRGQIKNSDDYIENTSNNRSFSRTDNEIKSVNNWDKQSQSYNDKNSRTHSQDSNQHRENSRPYNDINKRDTYNTSFRTKNEIPPRFQKQYPDRQRKNEFTSNQDTYNDNKKNDDWNTKKHNIRTDDWNTNDTKKHNTQTDDWNTNDTKKHNIQTDDWNTKDTKRHNIQTDDWNTKDTKKHNIQTDNWNTKDTKKHNIQTDDWETENTDDNLSYDFKISKEEITIPSQMEVIVCWWLSPQNFFIQHKNRVEDFENFMSKIQMFYKNKTPSNLSPNVDNYAIVRFNQDNVMYRAKILAQNENLQKYKVEFIDFGNRSIVDKKDIWPIEKSFTDTSIMAHSCSLDGITIKSDIKTISNYVEKYFTPNNDIVCKYIRQENDNYYVDIEVNGKSIRNLLLQEDLISEDCPDTEVDLHMLCGQTVIANITNIVDLLNFEVNIEGFNVNLSCSFSDVELVKSNENLSLEFKEKYEGTSCAIDISSISKENVLIVNPLIPLLKDGLIRKICRLPVASKYFTGKIIFIDSSDILYVQYSNLEDKASELLDELYEYYSVQGENLDANEAGTLCVAKSSDDNWYRAVIVSQKLNLFTVYYIDYGNTENIEGCDNLKKLEDNFYNTSALAIKVYLPFESIASDNEIKSEIQVLTANKDISFKIIEVYKSRLIVDITVDNSNLLELLEEKSLIKRIKDETIKTKIDNEIEQQLFLLENIIHQPNFCYKDENKILENVVKDTYLAYFENPGKFYLQMVNEFDELTKLQEDLQIVASSLQPVTKLTQNMLCIALYSSDKTWYRAKIIDSEIMAVHFIDYGNTDIVSDISFIRKMNEAFVNIKPFTFQCSLPVQPANGIDWSEDVNAIFTDAYEKILKCTIISKVENINYVHLDIDGQKYPQLLIEKNFAEEIEIIKSETNCFISHTNNLNDFYIQMESDVDGLEIMSDHLSGYENFPVLRDYKPGDICAAIFPDDGLWYRGKILDVKESGADVLFIDYGNKTFTTELREITQEIADILPFSKQCSLYKPDSIIEWSQRAEEKFIELSAGGEVVFIVKLKKPGICSIIELYSNDQNIIEELEILCDKISQSTTEINSVVNNDTIITEENLQEIFISHVNSPLSFYVQFNKNINLLTEINEKLNNQELKPIDKVQLNQICIAKYPDDNLLYRAKILSVDKTTKVIFIDFGNESDCDEFYELDENLNLIPELSLHCALQPITNINLESDEAKNIFNSIIFDENSLCKNIEIIDKTNETAIVKMYIGEKEINNELETLLKNNFEGIDSNLEDTIEIGYDSNEEFDVIITHINTLTDFYIQFAKNITQCANIKSKLQNNINLCELKNPSLGDLCVIFCSKNKIYYRAKIISMDLNVYKVFLIDYGKEIKVEIVFELPMDLRSIEQLSVQCAIEKIDSNDIENSDIEVSFKKILTTSCSQAIKMKILRKENNISIVEIFINGINVRDPLIPSSVPKIDNVTPFDNKHCKKELVRITFINSANDFYIQKTIHKEQLTKINQIITEEDNLEPVLEPKIGNLYLVESSQDNKFYRAKILSAEENFFKVFFIDYGNTETIKQENFYIIPKEIQHNENIAQRCKLHCEEHIDLESQDCLEKFRNFIAINSEIDIEAEFLDFDDIKWSVRLYCEEKCFNNDIIQSLCSSNIMKEKQNVLISHINSLSEFYVQLVSDLDGIENMKKIANSEKCLDELTEPKVGDYCFAFNNEDLSYNRAQVLSLEENGCNVQCIDTGIVYFSKNLCKISKDDEEIPGYAKCCSLILTEECSYILSELNDLFKKKVNDTQEAKFEIEISSKEDNWIVNLVVNNENLLDLLLNDVKKIKENVEVSDSINDNLELIQETEFSKTSLPSSKALSLPEICQDEIIGCVDNIEISSQHIEEAVQQEYTDSFNEIELVEDTVNVSDDQENVDKKLISEENACADNENNIEVTNITSPDTICVQFLSDVNSTDQNIICPDEDKINENSPKFLKNDNNNQNSQKLSKEEIICINNSRSTEEEMVLTHIGSPNDVSVQFLVDEKLSDETTVCANVVKKEQQAGIMQANDDTVLINEKNDCEKLIEDENVIVEKNLTENKDEDTQELTLTNINIPKDISVQLLSDIKLIENNITRDDVDQVLQTNDFVKENKDILNTKNYENLNDYESYQELLKLSEEDETEMKEDKIVSTEKNLKEIKSADEDEKEIVFTNIDVPRDISVQLLPDPKLSDQSITHVDVEDVSLNKEKYEGLNDNVSSQNLVQDKIDSVENRLEDLKLSEEDEKDMKEDKIVSTEKNLEEIKSADEDEKEIVFTNIDVPRDISVQLLPEPKLSDQSTTHVDVEDVSLNKEKYEGLNDNVSSQNLVQDKIDSVENRLEDLKLSEEDEKDMKEDKIVSTEKNLEEIKSADEDEKEIVFTNIDVPRDISVQLLPEPKLSDQSTTHVDVEDASLNKEKYEGLNDNVSSQNLVQDKINSVENRLEDLKLSEEDEKDMKEYKIVSTEKNLEEIKSTDEDEKEIVFTNIDVPRDISVQLLPDPKLSDQSITHVAVDKTVQQDHFIQKNEDAILNKEKYENLNDIESSQNLVQDKIDSADFKLLEEDEKEIVLTHINSSKDISVQFLSGVKLTEGNITRVDMDIVGQEDDIIIQENEESILKSNKNENDCCKEDGNFCVDKKFEDSKQPNFSEDIKETSSKTSNETENKSSENLFNN